MHAVSDGHADRQADAPRVLQWSVFLTAAGVVASLCLLILRPFFPVGAWSLVLAITCHPLHQWLARRTGRPALSAFVTSALMVLAVLVPLGVIGGVALHQLAALGDSLRHALLDPDGTSRRVAALFAPLTRRLGLDAQSIADWVGAHSGEWIAGAGQRTLSAAAGAGGAAVSMALTAFATFFLLRHGDRLVVTVRDLLPFEPGRSEALLRRIRDAVFASVNGVVTIAAIQGVLCGAMFWVLGVPGAALWGLVTVFASMVPFVGAAGVWVPGTVYLLATGAWPKALVLAVWGAAVVSGIDNILRPRLLAGRVRLSGLVMFVAMLGGLQAFGAVGMILGPVLFATAAAILEAVPEAQRLRLLETGAPAPNVPSPGARRVVVD